MFLINKQLPNPGATPRGYRPPAFRSPAREHAYDFTVEVHYRKNESLRRRTSPWLDERERDGILQLAREASHKVSRGHSIFDPGEAEKAINAELDRRLFDAGQRTQRPWTVWVMVTAPDDVRTMIREGIRDRYTIESKGHTDELRIRTTEVLEQRWSAFLQEAAKNPAAPYALTLAEDPAGIPGVLQQMLAEREQNADEWLTLITRIVEAHQSAGILDLVVESDTVLRKTLEMMGIQVPALDSDAFFVPDKLDP